jgi:hypothetical protein
VIVAGMPRVRCHCRKHQRCAGADRHRHRPRGVGIRQESAHINYISAEWLRFSSLAHDFGLSGYRHTQSPLSKSTEPLLVKDTMPPSSFSFQSTE